MPTTKGAPRADNYARTKFILIQFPFPKSLALFHLLVNVEE